MTNETERTDGTDASPADAADGAFGIERRSIMRALGAGVAAGAGIPGVAAADPGGNGGGRGGGEDSNGEKQIDPVWGYTDIVEEFPEPEDLPPQIRPDHVVELHAGITYRGKKLPALHFHPTGLQIEPGDVVMFQLHSPHHSVTAYHEGLRGGQRVPDGVGPFSSPVLPVGGYWLYRFGPRGVYDLYCEPHEFFGMVMRIVAHPEKSKGKLPEGYGPGVRGPSPFNLINFGDCLGFESPPFHVPSSAEALSSDALSVENVVESGDVHYDEVFGEFQEPSE